MLGLPQVCGLLIAVASLVVEHRLQDSGGLEVVSHELQSAGSVVGMHGLSYPRDVESSQTRNGTSVLCIARQILTTGAQGSPGPLF